MHTKFNVWERVCAQQIKYHQSVSPLVHITNSVTFFFGTKKSQFTQFYTFRCTLLTFNTHPPLKTILALNTYLLLPNRQKKKTDPIVRVLPYRELFVDKNWISGVWIGELNAHPRYALILDLLHYIFIMYPYARTTHTHAS